MRWVSRIPVVSRFPVYHVRKDDQSQNLRHILVVDGEGRTAVVEDGGGHQGRAGGSPSLGCVGQIPAETTWDNGMPSILIFPSYLLGNFGKLPYWIRNCSIANTIPFHSHPFSTILTGPGHPLPSILPPKSNISNLVEPTSLPKAACPTLRLP